MCEILEHPNLEVAASAGISLRSALAENLRMGQSCWQPSSASWHRKLALVWRKGLLDCLVVMITPGRHCSDSILGPSYSWCGAAVAVTGAVRGAGPGPHLAQLGRDDALVPDRQQGQHLIVVGRVKQVRPQEQLQFHRAGVGLQLEGRPYSGAEGLVVM